MLSGNKAPCGNQRRTVAAGYLNSSTAVARRTGWVFRSRSNDLQSFDNLGRLVALTSGQGLSVSLSYSTHGLDRAVDPFGRALVFAPTIDTATGYKYREAVTDPAGTTGFITSGMVRARHKYRVLRRRRST